MLKINRLQDQLILERNKRQQLEDQLSRQTANLDYIAMMADVNIPSEDNTDTEGGSRDVHDVY